MIRNCNLLKRLKRINKKTLWNLFSLPIAIVIIHSFIFFIFYISDNSGLDALLFMYYVWPVILISIFIIWNIKLIRDIVINFKNKGFMFSNLFILLLPYSIYAGLEVYSYLNEQEHFNKINSITKEVPYEEKASYSNREIITYALSNDTAFILTSDPYPSNNAAFIKIAGDTVGGRRRLYTEFNLDSLKCYAVHNNKIFQIQDFNSIIVNQYEQPRYQARKKKISPDELIPQNPTEKHYRQKSHYEQELTIIEIVSNCKERSGFSQLNQHLKKFNYHLVSTSCRASFQNSIGVAFAFVRPNTIDPDHEEEQDQKNYTYIVRGIQSEIEVFRLNIPSTDINFRDIRGTFVLNSTFYILDKNKIYSFRIS